MTPHKDFSVNEYKIEFKTINIQLLQTHYFIFFTVDLVNVNKAFLKNIK